MESVLHLVMSSMERSPTFKSEYVENEYFSLKVWWWAWIFILFFIKIPLPRLKSDFSSQEIVPQKKIQQKNSLKLAIN